LNTAQQTIQISYQVDGMNPVFLGTGIGLLVAGVALALVGRRSRQRYEPPRKHSDIILFDKPTREQSPTGHSNTLASLPLGAAVNGIVMPLIAIEVTIVNLYAVHRRRQIPNKLLKSPRAENDTIATCLSGSTAVHQRNDGIRAKMSDLGLRDYFGGAFG
jgi:hypothetical protein